MSELLPHFDPNLEMVVASDISESCIGIVSLQKYEDDNMKTVAHVSCSLLSAEKSYSQIKETLAMKLVVQKFL